MNTNLQEKRTQWLELAGTLTRTAAERRSLYDHELAPDNNLPSNEDKKAAQKKANELTKEISTLSSRLALIERQATIGSKALGIDDELARTVLAVLVTARLSSYIGREARRVGDIVDLIGGQNPERCLAVRCLFRESDGLLFPFVWIGRTPVLDDATVYLTEKAFNLVCGLESESQKICDAVGMLGK